MNLSTIELVQRELDREADDKLKGKLSPRFIDDIADRAVKIYIHPTPTMRICIMQLCTGHEVYGVAQVLKEENDCEAIGNEVAYDNAKGKIWESMGSIAKALL